MLEDDGIKGELSSATATEMPEVMAKAGSSRGFDFTADEVREVLATPVEEMGEEELEQVAGGMCMPLVLCLPSGTGANLGTKLNLLNKQFDPNLAKLSRDPRF